ncbi:MAG: hypothetical protein AABX72_02375 [Nanoarchaeota archaeon]
MTETTKRHKTCLEDFGFYIDDHSFHKTAEPIKGFSSLRISIHPAEFLEVYKSIFEERDGTKHYWLDTSFLLESSHIYGQCGERNLRLSNASFLNACASGLAGIGQEYDELWYEFQKVQELQFNELERLIHRNDVTILPEILEEYITGDDRCLKKRMETQNGSYKKMMERYFIEKSRLARQMGCACQRDETLKMLNRCKVDPVLQYSTQIAESNRINTGGVDNLLTAYALANAAGTGNTQIIVTGDNGIVDLLGVLPRHSPDGVKIDVSERYYSPLKTHEIEVVIREVTKK